MNEYNTIDKEIDDFAIETIDFVLGELEQLNCYDLFNTYNSLNDIDKFKQYSQGTTYKIQELEAFTEKINCSYEQVLNTYKKYK